MSFVDTTSERSVLQCHFFDRNAGSNVQVLNCTSAEQVISYVRFTAQLSKTLA